MTNARRTHDVADEGFSIVEIVLALAIMSFAGIVVATMLKTPVSIAGFMQAADQQQIIARATDLIANDLKEADPTSIPWDTISAGSSNYTDMSLRKITYDMANVGTVGITNISYSFQPVTAGATHGTMMRSVTTGGTTTSTPLISNLDAPSADNPFFQKDPSSYNIVVMTLLYHPTGQPLTRFIRQVAIKG